MQEIQYFSIFLSPCRPAADLAGARERADPRAVDHGALHAGGRAARQRGHRGGSCHDVSRVTCQLS